MNVKVTLEQIKTLPQELAKGRTIQDIASTLGVSKRTIHYWIKRLRKSGVEVPIRRGKRPLDLGGVDTITHN